MISQNLKYRILTSLILLLLVFLILNYNFILVYSCIVLGILSFLEFSQIINKIFKRKTKILLSNIFFIIFLFFFYSVILFSINLPHYKTVIFFLLVGCIASDIGGFVVGKNLKGPKLTSISPNKTISGSIGSLIFTSTTMIWIYYYFLGNIKIEIFYLSLITSIACQTGDLIFSYFKRRAKIKDTGKFLPGHGGILDRLDGIYLGIPISLLSLLIIF